MKISDLLKERETTVSFEVFPPKQWDKIDGTKAVVREMAKSSPDFMSVTYSASGSGAGFTMEIAKEIKDSGIVPLSHLTCLTSTKDKIHSVLEGLKENHIENILALRGDIPKDFDFPDELHFKYAYQLIEEINDVGDFCIGGACYPEMHPESGNRVEDMEHLKEKADCGLSFLTTQMFFDNSIFFDFCERCQIKGINIPIIAGIMPITNANQMKRTLELSNATVPKKFYRIMDHFGDNPESMKQAGIVYAAEQIIDLMANGFSHIHIYTMNHPDVAAEITKMLPCR